MPRSRRLQMFDAQSTMGFLQSQVTYIEREVYRIAYPDVQYQDLIPVDTSAPEWIKSVTYYSMDRVGKADWFHHQAKDVPLVELERTKFETTVEMAAIGYRYDSEELGHAMMLGIPLTSEKADAARRAYEEFVDQVGFTGTPTGVVSKGWTGLINNTNVDVIDAAATGTGGSAAWADKTGDQIAKDINDALTAVYSESRTVEMADTVLLPVNEMSLLSTKRMDSAGSDLCVLDWVRRYNVFTQTTGRPITIKAVRALENAAEGGDAARMVVYRKDPRVLKMHIPMPHRFLPVWQTGPMTFDVPGVFRLGGVDIRLPGAVRYVDGIGNYTS